LGIKPGLEREKIVKIFNPSHLLHSIICFIIANASLPSLCLMDPEWSDCTVPPLEPYNAYSFNPCWNLDCGAILAIEALWWTVCQDNLDFAVEFDPKEEEFILGPGEIKFLKHDWCPGVQGTIGFRRWGWHLRGVYTWYRNLSCDEVKKDVKAALLHPETGFEDANKAKIDSAILYQTYALLIGKDLCFSERTIFLLPYFGVKGLNLDQNLDVLYEGAEFIDPSCVRWHSDLQAVGLVGGLEMHYHWICKIGLYGTFNGSVLASRTHVQHRQETLDEDDAIVSTEIAVREKEWVCVPGYQLSAGLRWGFECSRFTLLLKAGYELNYWFNTPQLRRYHFGNEAVSSDAFGNTGFHGATLSATIYF